MLWLPGTQWGQVEGAQVFKILLLNNCEILDDFLWTSLHSELSGGGGVGEGVRK